MIYFDNSASTLKKPKEVIKQSINALTNYTSNPGRSGHKLSTVFGEKIFNIRQNVAQFFNVPKVENVVFTSSCTESLNIGVLGTLQMGGHIICCSNCHNSLSRPIFELEKQNLVEVTVVTPKNREILTADDIAPHIKNNTYMIAVNHVSNVNGDMADIYSIGELCAKNCLLFLVDCAQSTGHQIIDMQKNHIDILAVAPHKGLYALQGVGILAFSVKANPNPIKFGGTGTESINLYQPLDYPESLESGTLPGINIIALEAGLNFVKNNFSIINKKIDDLATYLLFELDKIENVITYTSPQNIHFGVIAFNIKGMDSNEVTEILSDKYNICVRGGLHCAGLKHKALNTVETGIVRVSLSYFNTFSECEYFIKCIKKIIKTK